jgi:hypothetical protein
LKNLHWERKADSTEFYPRCFDLSEVDDRGKFFLFFRLGKVLALLKNYKEK